LILREYNPSTGITADFNPPKIDIKIPIKINDSWSSKYKDTNGQNVTTVTKVLRKENVTVPAGTFSAYYLTTTYSGMKRLTSARSWYVPEVGLVKSVENVGGQIMTFNLINYFVKGMKKIED
jgi:hypothetical protein